MKHRLTWLAAAVPLAAALPHAAQAQHVLDNGRLHVVFADTSAGLTGTDGDRVDEIAWIASNGTSTGNLAANGGPLHCNDPQEFFGQAYGESGDAHPYLVVGGSTAHWKGRSALAGKTKVAVKKVCDYVPDGATKTSYALSTAAARISQLTVQRVFDFKVANSSGNIRAYVPRLPIGTFSKVLWPNAAGVLQTGDVGGCSSNCEVDDWNGTWFADQNAAGTGLVVIRDPAHALPAVLVLDNDSFSNSNDSAVALQQPSQGWTGHVAESENLCFYDATTWPAASQAAGELPKGCTKP